jgi:hypothetical protein
MSKQSFEELVLQSLEKLEAGQTSLEKGQASLEAGQASFRKELDGVQKELRHLGALQEATYEQVEKLTNPFQNPISAAISS